MEWVAIFPLAIVIFLSYRLWHWWKTNGSDHILEKLSYRIRLKLGVVSNNELKVVQEHLLSLEYQMHTRLAHLENPRQFTKYPSSIDFLNIPFKHVPSSNPAKEDSFLRPRSIVWNGLRFTFSDSIWSYVEVNPREILSDSQVQAMVQGPFCRNCLKRLTRRNPVHAAEVPAQCHYCGLSWNNAASVNLPVSLADLKRRLVTALNANGE